MKIIGQIRSCPHAIVDILLYQKLIDIISIVIQYPSEEPATSKSPKNQKIQYQSTFFFFLIQLRSYDIQKQEHVDELQALLPGTKILLVDGKGLVGMGVE